MAESAPPPRRRQAPPPFLRRLCDPDGGPDDTRVLLVVAHPDDEVIGAGTRLPRLREVRVVFVTDGAPADLRDARKLGFGTREAYAEARAGEALDALAMAGVGPSRVARLGLVDQEASFAIADLARSLAAAVRDAAAEVVLVHPFEGGHPDHDAAALATRLACKVLRDGGGEAPEVMEFAGYHRGGWRGIRIQEFLPSGSEVVTARLDAAERDLKRRLLACHATQAGFTRLVPVDRERFRAAPAHDFRAPPHPGRPFYERLQGRITGERWRELAGRALDAFGVDGPL